MNVRDVFAKVRNRRHLCRFEIWDAVFSVSFYGYRSFAAVASITPGASGSERGENIGAVAVLSVAADALRVVGAPAGVESADERLECWHGCRNEAVVHFDIQADEGYDCGEKRLVRSNGI